MQRESAAWQHHVAIAFLLVSAVLVLSPFTALFKVPFPVPANSLLFAELNPYQFLALAAVYCAVGLTFLMYRLLSLVALAQLERHYPVAPEQVQCIIKQFGPALASAPITARVAPEHTVNAYVWQPQPWAGHRLVVTAGLLALPLAQQRIVLAHEYAHCTRHDWLLQQGAFAVACLFWPLKPIWTQLKKTQALAERAADDRALWLLTGDTDGSHKNHYNKNLSLEFAQLLLAVKQARNPVTEAKTNSGLVQAAAGVQGDFYHRLHSLLAYLNNHSPLHPFERKHTPWLLAIWLVPLLLIGWQPIYTQTFAVQRLQLTLPNFPKINDNPIYDAASGPAWADLIKPVRLSNVAPPLTRRLEIADPLQEELLVTVEAPLFNTTNSITWQTPTVALQGWLAETTVTPKYPARAIRAGVNGEVVVGFAIDHKGRATEVRVISAHPTGWFEHSVLSSLQQSQFKPLLVNGEPVKVSGLTEAYRFELQ